MTTTTTATAGRPAPVFDPPDTDLLLTETSAWLAGQLLAGVDEAAALDAARQALDETMARWLDRLLEAARRVAVEVAADPRAQAGNL